MIALNVKPVWAPIWRMYSDPHARDERLTFKSTKQFSTFIFIFKCHFTLVHIFSKLFQMLLINPWWMENVDMINIIFTMSWASHHWSSFDLMISCFYINILVLYIYISNIVKDLFETFLIIIMIMKQKPKVRNQIYNWTNNF